MKSNNSETSRKDRRAALTKLTAIGAVPLLLPEKWSRPIANAVFSPAHAQMSPTSGTDDGSEDADLMCGIDMLEFRTPGTYNITLPSDAATISVVVAGAAGGTGGDGGTGFSQPDSMSGDGGSAEEGLRGRTVSNSVAVTGGSELTIIVGGQGGEGVDGTTATSGEGASGGTPGGAAGSGEISGVEDAGQGQTGESGSSNEQGGGGGGSGGGGGGASAILDGSNTILIGADGGDGSGGAGGGSGSGPEGVIGNPGEGGEGAFPGSGGAAVSDGGAGGDGGFGGSGGEGGPSGESGEIGPQGDGYVTIQCSTADV